MFNRFNTIPVCNGQTDGQTDRQTDRHLATAYIYYEIVHKVHSPRYA